MAALPKTEPVEHELLELLRERGWSVGDVSRDGPDLIAALTFESCNGVLRVLHATELDRLGPAFIRFALGEAETPSLAWSCWELPGPRVDEGDNESTTRFREGGQAAIGSGWTVAGLGIWPMPTPRAWTYGTARFVQRVERLAPLRNEKERLAVFEDDPDVLERAKRERFKSTVLAVVVLLGGGLGAFGLLLFGFLSLSDETAVSGVILLFWFVGIAVLMIVLSRRERNKRRDAWAKAIGLLQSSGMFDKLDRGPVLEPLGIAVLRKLAEGRGVRHEPLCQQQIQAESSRLGLKAEVRLGRIDFAKSTVASCKIVPEAFFSVRFFGSDQRLSALPPWSRSWRTKGQVRITFTDEDVKSGKTEAWLARALGAETGDAYRVQP